MGRAERVADRRAVTPDGVVAGVHEALLDVEDPELPVRIVDLGMVREVCCTADAVVVRLAPTFLACPALWMVEADVKRAAEAVPGVTECRIEWVAGGWSGADVNASGRAALAAVGLAVPGSDGSVTCPHCGSASVQETSPFGSAVCRTAAFCEACRTPVEVLKTKRPPVAGSAGAHRPLAVVPR